MHLHEVLPHEPLRVGARRLRALRRGAQRGRQVELADPDRQRRPTDEQLVGGDALLRAVPRPRAVGRRRRVERQRERLEQQQVGPDPHDQRVGLHRASLLALAQPLAAAHLAQHAQRVGEVDAAGQWADGRHVPVLRADGRVLVQRQLGRQRGAHGAPRHHRRQQLREQALGGRVVLQPAEELKPGIVCSSRRLHQVGLQSGGERTQRCRPSRGAGDAHSDHRRRYDGGGLARL